MDNGVVHCRRIVFDELVLRNRWGTGACDCLGVRSLQPRVVTDSCRPSDAARAEPARRAHVEEVGGVARGGEKRDHEQPEEHEHADWDRERHQARRRRDLRRLDRIRIARTVPSAILKYSRCDE
jgi:hypothetical protein